MTRLSILDYAYFTVVAIGILLWIAAVLLYIDKARRERKWKERPLDVTEVVARRIRFFNDDPDVRELIR